MPARPGQIGWHPSHVYPTASGMQRLLMASGCMARDESGKPRRPLSWCFGSRCWVRTNVGLADGFTDCHPSLPSAALTCAYTSSSAPRRGGVPPRFRRQHPRHRTCAELQLGNASHASGTAGDTAQGLRPQDKVSPGPRREPPGVRLWLRISRPPPEAIDGRAPICPSPSVNTIAALEVPPPAPNDALMSCQGLVGYRFRWWWLA